jgi:hypothetical protein
MVIGLGFTTQSARRTFGKLGRPPDIAILPAAQAYFGAHSVPVGCSPQALNARNLSAPPVRWLLRTNEIKEVRGESKADAATKTNAWLFAGAI